MYRREETGWAGPVIITTPLRVYFALLRFFFAGFFFLELEALVSLSGSVDPGVEGLCLCLAAAILAEVLCGLDDVVDEAAVDVDARDSASDSDDGSLASSADLEAAAVAAAATWAGLLLSSRSATILPSDRLARTF